MSDRTARNPDEIARRLKLDTGCFVLVAIAIILLTNACGLVITVAGAILWEPTATAEQPPAAREAKNEGERVLAVTDRTSTVPNVASTSTQSNSGTQPSAPAAALAFTQSVTTTLPGETPGDVGAAPASLAASQQFFALVLLADVAILFPAINTFAKLG